MRRATKLEHPRHWLQRRSVSKPKRQIRNREAVAREEARIMREAVDRMIDTGEIRAFMIKHGFVTPGGRLTRRYGG